MNISNWTSEHTTTAKSIWSDYQRAHDLSDRFGQTVGIDPASGHLWFGQSIADVVSKRDAAGIDAPLFFERVGSHVYWRKGRRR